MSIVFLSFSINSQELLIFKSGSSTKRTIRSSSSLSKFHEFGLFFITWWVLSESCSFLVESTVLQREVIEEQSGSRLGISEIFQISNEQPSWLNVSSETLWQSLFKLTFPNVVGVFRLRSISIFLSIENYSTKTVDIVLLLIPPAALLRWVLRQLLQGFNILFFSCQDINVIEPVLWWGGRWELELSDFEVPEARCAVDQSLKWSRDAWSGWGA